MKQKKTAEAGKAELMGSKNILQRAKPGYNLLKNLK